MVLAPAPNSVGPLCNRLLSPPQPWQPPSLCLLPSVMEMEFGVRLLPHNVMHLNFIRVLCIRSLFYFGTITFKNAFLYPN